MYALEDEPEKEGRWKRLGGGALLAVTLSAGLIYGADKFEPTRRLLEKVVKLTVTVELPKPPPPTKLPPLPPPPKRLAPKQKLAKQNVPTPKPQSNEPQQVGLDDASFGEGTGGPSFAVGNTAMGAPPTTAYAPPVVKKVEATPAHPLVYREARPMKPVPPQYTERARKLGIQGLMVLEVDIDDRGRVTAVRLRRGLEPGLDQQALRTVKTTPFQPATRGGRSVPSTYFFRIRYQLEG